LHTVSVAFSPERGKVYQPKPLFPAPL
jgi:hypothetical protein